MTIKGAAESSRLSVRFEPNVRATVHDDAGTLRAGFGCLGTTRDVACGGLPGTQLLGPACLPCSARIELGEGNDTLTLTGTSQKGPFHVDAGGGDDEVHIAGESIALVDGGPGSDVLRADAISELDGGEGPDMLQGAGAFASYAARTAGVTVTLDGVANDGAPGEGDNVTTGSVLGTEGPDRLTGNGAVNDLSGRGGDDVLAGADGNDELSGDAGANTIHAGDGDDRVAGSRVDTVKCGLGDDVATGLRVPGAYGDCETVFESYDVPYLTVSDVAVRRRRPSVTLGWHPYPDVVGGPAPRPTRARPSAASAGSARWPPGCWPLLVGVLDAQHEATAVVARVEPREAGRAHAAHVEQAGWRRREPRADRAGHGL